MPHNMHAYGQHMVFALDNEVDDALAQCELECAMFHCVLETFTVNHMVSELRA